MKTTLQFAVTILTILLITSGNMQAAQAADFDHSKFDQILKSYVDPEGRVDYNGIAVDDAFHEYITSLENAKADALSRDGQLAFWINAYNAVTKAMAFLDRMPKMSYISYDWALNAKEPLK